MAKRQRCNICNISAIFRPVALWWVEYFVALTQFGRYKRQNRHMIYTPCSDVWNYRWKWSWGVVISNCDFLFNVAKFHGKKLFHLNLSMIPPYYSHLNILYLSVWKGWSHRRSLSYYWWGSNSVFIGPESDHWECLSLTHSLLFSKLDWCDPGLCSWQLKTCCCCHCCSCW